MRRRYLTIACGAAGILATWAVARAQPSAAPPAPPASAAAPAKAPAKAVPAKAPPPAKASPAAAVEPPAPAGGAGGAEGALDIREALQKLRSSNLDEMRGAVEMLGVSGSPAAARALIDLLRSGPPAAVIDPALDALGALGRPEAEGVLVEHMDHRRAEVRLKATTLVAGLRSPRAQRALEAALSDSDHRVRAAAATALARTATRESMPVLLRAFDRGIAEVSAGLGRLGTTAECDRLLTQLGRTPLPSLLPALREFLNRRDFPEPAKLNIVQKLVELAGGEVKRFLREWVGGLAPTDRGAVRRAAEEAIQRIVD